MDKLGTTGRLRKSQQVVTQKLYGGWYNGSLSRSLRTAAADSVKCCCCCKKKFVQNDSSVSCVCVRKYSWPKCKARKVIYGRGSCHDNTA